MSRISISQLFEENHTRVKLEWLAGRAGGNKTLDVELTKESAQGLIGHLNFIHPNLIQVLGAPEMKYLESMEVEDCASVLQESTRHELACFIVAGSTHIAPQLLKIAEQTDTPLLSSPFSSVELMWMLRPYLARAMAQCLTVHGVMLDVLGLGVLITGDSGAGKSELALELISRGSGLIADDVVELYRVGPEYIDARCPAILKDFLEVRGLGVLNIRSIFGEAAIRPRKALKLIVQLERPTGIDTVPAQRLPLKPGTESIMGVELSKVAIPVAAGRNLAVLTEAAVRNHVLQTRGIDSTREFISRQADLMKGPFGEDKTLV